MPRRGPVRRARPTIFDVAEATGVSYSTVSRVVNGREHIHPNTRARVKAAMLELGYVAHRPAQTLASGRTRTIGLLAMEVESAFFRRIIGGVDEQVAAYDYDFMLCTTRDDRGKETEYVSRLSHGMVDGLLVVLPRGLTDYVKQLHAEHFPFVIIDHDAEMPGTNIVNATNHAGARAAIDHLLDLGHTRIAFITGTRGVGTTERRLEAFREALALRGLEVDESLIAEGDFLEHLGYEHTRRLLQLDRRPSAIFASSDAAAMGVLRAAREQGVSVPKDLSVVGFDDAPEAAWMTPALTTVHQPLREMGKTAVRMLMGILREPERPTSTIAVATSLVARDTTARPREAS